MTLSWEGVWPAALTMFDANGALDEDATAEHLDWLIDEGVHGLVIGGTSGEFVALTDNERRRLTDLALSVAGGRVPVIVGTGTYATAPTIEQTRYAALAGAAGALVVLPYFQRPSRREVLEHFRSVARSTDIPLLVYNIPANAATAAVTVDDLEMLHRDGVISGVKSTGPLVHQINELRSRTDDSFRVFYGGALAGLEGLSGGAHGWVSGLLNIIPREAVSMWDALAQGDLLAARQIWEAQLRYRRMVAGPVIADVSDLALYRGVLRIRGQRAGFCRGPLRDLSAVEMRQLETALAG